MSSSGLHPRLSALQPQFSASPLQRIHDEQWRAQGVELWMKRDDLLHPVISGNKWRKLKYCINQALHLGCDTLVSMGGAYSNHLHALAYAGQRLGLKTRAYVRGECPEALNATLQDLQQWGMKLDFISRSDYRQLRLYKAHDAAPVTGAGEYWIAEGGAAALALPGVAEIIKEVGPNFDVMATACGTATTLAGLIAAAVPGQQLLGVAALKGGEFLYDDVRQLLADQQVDASWRIALDYHHGGFAKRSEQLVSFVEDFQTRHNVTLETVYTGKLVYALFRMLERGDFAKGQRVIALHTGGLQGERKPRSR